MSRRSGRTRAQSAALGRANQRVGEDFERWAQGHYNRALELGIVVHPVEHNKPGARVTGAGLIHTGKGIADRTGILADGCTLAVEEKSVDGDALSRRAVKPRQAAYLDAVARLGHAAILLVEYRIVGERRRFAVPWKELRWWQGPRGGEWLLLGTLRDAWEVPESEACFLARFCTARLPPEQRALVKRRVFARE